MSVHKVETRVGREVLSIETGKMARQADGAAVVTYGETVVLVTVVSRPPPDWANFFPLRADYREMTYAAGKFPGGFFKREGRPTSKETLTCRLMDRPIRPLFPDGYREDVQMIAVVLSADKKHDPDVLAMVGASAALTLSPAIPFAGPTGAVRIGKVGDEFIINPTHEERNAGTLDLVVAGTERAVVMIEGDAQEASDEEVLEAINLAQRAIREVIRIQMEMAAAVGVKRPEIPEVAPDPLAQELEARYFDRLAEANRTRGKFERRDALKAVADQVIEEYADRVAAENGTTESDLRQALEKVEKKAVRHGILEGTRGDGRSPTDIREITSEVAVLPRVHGSSLFTRGETQALVTCTLGTVGDEQRVEGLEEEYRKKFMLDYNFPPFCVGEVKPLRGPSRRDYGHGHLAETSLQPVLPAAEEFPYTIRIVSDILESNGSSSMASVCGGTLCLMDAGVPIKEPVAGIAMGLVVEGDRAVILSDIAGEEDHCGDMDLKIAGTRHGITAIQMDLKITGVDEETLGRAFEQARQGRLAILGEMLLAIDKPRPQISEYAPRLLLIKVNPEKIGLIIGPGGKMVRSIQEQTNSTIEIEDDGTITISSLSAEGAEKAKATILAMTEDPEIGKTYLGRVAAVKDFGCFVEIMPGRDGLVHVSELSDSFVKDVSSICKVGDEMLVKLIAIDDQNRLRLSRKAALKESD